MADSGSQRRARVQGRVQGRALARAPAQVRAQVPLAEGWAICRAAV